MSGGRTIWWAKDVEWWLRERVVELGQEFGTEGPGVILWLSCRAKAQRDGGRVRSGFRAIAHGAFVAPKNVEAIVRRAVEVGLLDDFESEGRTFSCRLSGWKADQEKAQAAARQARSRGPVTDRDEPQQTVTDRDEPSATGQDSTRQKTEDSLRSSSRPEISRLCHLLADLVLERDPKSKAKAKADGKAWQDACRLLLDRDGRSPDEVEAVVRWCQADSFEHKNVLGMPKLRERFDQLTLKMKAAPIRGAVADRSTDPLAKPEGWDGWVREHVPDLDPAEAAAAAWSVHRRFVDVTAERVRAAVVARYGEGEAA